MLHLIGPGPSRPERECLRANELTILRAGS
jgi:hypothetical protein